MVDVQVNVGESCHVNVRYPHQREERYQVSAPVGIKKSKVSDQQEYRGNVVAETIFAGKEVKKLPSPDSRRPLALILAVITWFSEYFLVSDGPCDAGNRDRQNQEPQQLCG